MYKLNNFSRFCISNSLKQLLNLKLSQTTMPATEVNKQLQVITQNIDPTDFDKFMTVYKEFPYSLKDVAMIFNQSLDARELLQAKHKHLEQDVVLRQAYTQLLANQQVKVEFQTDLLSSHLTEEANEYFTKLNNAGSIEQAYLQCVEVSSFYLQFKKCKQLTKDHEIQQCLLMLQNDILGEVDISNLIYKVFLAQQLQIWNPVVMDHFAKQILKTTPHQLTSQHLIVYAYILIEWMIRLGFRKPMDVLIHKMDQFIQKIPLSLIEKSYILRLLNTKVDMPSKQPLLCQPISEEYKQLDLSIYPSTFMALCNNYWAGINLKEHEQYITNNIEQFTLNQDIISLLRGLIWAESQNIDLIDQLMNKITIKVNNNQKSIKFHCTLYQIVYCLEQLYDYKPKSMDVEYLKHVYFNRVFLRNNNDYSPVEQEINEILVKLRDEFEQMKRPNWRISKIEKQINSGIFSIDFKVELEGIYKKRYVLLDVIGGSNFQQGGKGLSGKLRLRYRLLKNDDLRIVNITQWHKQQDKEQFIRQLLGI